MEKNVAKMEEQIPLETIIVLNYINRIVPEIEEIKKLNTDGFGKSQKWHIFQIYNEMAGYIAHKLKAYGVSKGDNFDKLAKKLVFIGKSLTCPSTFDYIIEQAKFVGVSPKKYVDDAFAIEEPQEIISFLVPYEKEAAHRA